MNKYDICKNLKFSDCELAILRQAVDNAEENQGNMAANSPEVKRIIGIVETYIRKKQLICYGGTAINNILPSDDQFYNKEAEIPDYDFFTTDALNNAKELTNIYYNKGFTDVEAKSGIHHGTYKVFVNYIPVADITYIPKSIYKSIKADAIRVNGILYAPPNYLRMAMFLELSRPAGDISRWEKVLKRLTLLNKNYPLTNIYCENIEYQREMSNMKNEYEIYENVKNTFINQGVVFFGGYAISLYSKYMPKKIQMKFKKIADFDVLSNDPETTSQIVKERLKDLDIKNVKIIKRKSIGEIIPEHYEIKINNDTIAFIYKPIACHSYNIININNQKIKIATIDTMLSFYLAFLYADKPYYNDFLERILCISKFLYDVQQKNRLQQKGLLKRFSITCYGHQKTLEEIRAEKATKYKELKENINKDLFQEWFLNYKPDELHKRKEKNDKNDDKKKKKTLKNKTNKTNKTNKKQNKSFIDPYGRNNKKTNKKGLLF